MASSLVELGTGSTLTFASWTPQITSMDVSGISREFIDTSHLATAASGAGIIGNRTFVAGDLVDPGELSVTGHFNPDIEPPIDAAVGAITITFAETATWVSTAGMSNWSFSIPLDDKMEFTATIKFTGAITISAAS